MVFNGSLKILLRSYSMKIKTKLATRIAITLIFAAFTAVMVLLASLGGYWLVAISAILGFATGGLVWNEAEARVSTIPDDWYNDVGDVSRDFGKTKH